MKTNCYIDATSGSIDYHTQKYGILGFVATNNLGQVNFYHESAPDPVAGQKPVLADMFAILTQGDIVIVTAYLKLGCTTSEILDAISTIARKGARLCVVNTGFRLDGTGQAQVVAAACSLVSEIEHELASSRTAPVPVQDNGVDHPEIPPTHRSRRRSFLDGQEDFIRSLLSDSVPLAQISRKLGANRQTLKDFVISRNLMQ